MQPTTESAVVVPIPEAERLVGPLRADFDVAAALGVPAHVTVLAPFVPPVRIDDTVIAELAAAVGSVGSFEVTFSRVAWFDRSVLWLAPEPGEPFRALTRAVCERFPDYPPYRGEHQDVVPHLTVGIDQPVEALESAARTIERGLPVTARVSNAVLMQGSREPGSWSIVAELPLSR
jgi:2'-5' RNA ligase